MATDRVAGPFNQIVELNVSPSWWTLVHRRGNGPVPLALQVVCRELRRRDIVALLATKESLLIHLLDDEKTNHAELAEKIVKVIESSIEIEPIDLVDPAATVPEAKRIPRAELEAKLREYEFAEAVATTPDESTIWTLGGAAIYVGLAGDGADNNEAIWGSAAKAEPGKPVSYAVVLANLQRISDRGEVDDGEDVPGSVFDRPEVG
jgi:hypothetical protein